jgi:hypothetical protein
MKTLPFLMFFFLPLLACDTPGLAVKPDAKSAPMIRSTARPATPASNAAPPAKPHRETSTPRPAYLFM